MDGSEVIDIEALLAPIREDAPAGDDPRETFAPDARYYRLKDARAEARDLERRSAVDDDDEGGEARAHWRTIAQLAPEALREDAKDLEIAAWYIESLVRSDGFVGLAAGFRLAKGLVDGYWDSGLFPLPDEDGIETRVYPLGGLSGYDGTGALIRPVNMVPLTASGDAGPLSQWQYEQAAELEKLGDPEKVAARVAAGAVTLDDFRAAAARSPAGFLRARYQEAEAALEAFRALQAALFEKAGDDAPPGSNISGALDAILRTLRALDPSVAEAPADNAEDVAAGGAEANLAVAQGSAVPKAAPGVIATREDALAALSKVADFFEKTEPTSPISLTLRDVVRRARLSLPELLAELVPDETARENFFLRAGIRPPGASSEE